MINRSQLAKYCPSHWSTQLMLSCFLVQESKKEELSKWNKYLVTLPISYDVPYFDCPQDLLVHLPRNLRELFQEQIDLIQTQFQELDQQSVETSLKTFAWAWFTVNSRGVYFPDGHDNIALAPFLDMFNHSSEVQVKVEITPHCYNLISSHQAWPKLSQVFINYGPHDNVKLYLEYGFVIPNNPNDCVRLNLPDLFNACHVVEKEDLETKMAFIRDNQLNAGLQVVPGDEIVSWSVLACLFVLLNNDFKSVYEQDLKWTDFEVELEAMISGLKTELEKAIEKTSDFPSCRILPQLLRLQRDICGQALLALNKHQT